MLGLVEAPPLFLIAVYGLCRGGMCMQFRV